MVVVAPGGEAGVDDLRLAARRRGCGRSGRRCCRSATCRRAASWAPRCGSGVTWTTRRSVEAIDCVSSVLYSDRLRRGAGASCSVPRSRTPPSRSRPCCGRRRRCRRRTAPSSATRTAAPENFSSSPSAARYMQGVLPALLDPEPDWGRDVRLHLVRRGPLGVAELERRQAVAVQRGVDVGGVGVEALADHQARLAVRVLARCRETRCRPSGEQSPDTFFQAKWKASLANHMFSPLPATV